MFASAITNFSAITNPLSLQHRKDLAKFIENFKKRASNPNNKYIKYTASTQKVTVTVPSVQLVGEPVTPPSEPEEEATHGK